MSATIIVQVCGRFPGIPNCALVASTLARCVLQRLAASQVAQKVLPIHYRIDTLWSRNTFPKSCSRTTYGNMDRLSPCDDQPTYDHDDIHAFAYRPPSQTAIRAGQKRYTGVERSTDRLIAVMTTSSTPSPSGFYNYIYVTSLQSYLYQSELRTTVDSSRTSTFQLPTIS